MNKMFDNNNEGSREGYTSSGEGRGSQHSPRPRFTRTSRPAATSNSNGEYRPQRFNNNEGGYQPRQSWGGRSEGNNARGGYQPRGSYQQRGGDYRQGKSRYGQNDGDYSANRSGNNSFAGRRYQNDGGYRQRNNNEGGFGGSRGYQPRGEQREGFRPRYQGGNNYNNNRPRPQRGNYDPHAKYSQKKRLEYKEENYDPTVPVRLNKFLANAGVCSRRDADKYIEAGVVSVNGTVVTELGTKVLRTDEVKFHDNVVKMEKKVYVLLNKPKGYVTTSEDPQNRKTVMDLVQNACPERIYPVGRLDRNTTGVLLLTNDGELASKLTHPKFLKKKIYHVTTDQNVTAADLRRIAEGVTLEDGEIKADDVQYTSETDKKQVGIEIHSGKNRIVRRIFESLGYHVVKLDRVYFAGLTKKNVRRGDWRYLTEREVQMLRMGAFD